MRRQWPRTLVLITWLAAAAGVAGQERPPGPQAPDGPPGRPAPPEVVAEIRQTLDEAIRRFNTRDARGVLAYVSDRYRTGPLTKAGIAEQLHAIFALNDQVTARVRIDGVRMVGETAWVYTTGDVVGRPRWLGGIVPVFSWERELEVARREAGGWRLIGYQQ